MPKLACPCGYVHDLSPIPDDGFVLLHDTDTDELLFNEPRATVKVIVERTGRAYECFRCGRLMVRRPGEQIFAIFSPNPDSPLIHVDRLATDSLGGVFLEGPRAEADVAAQHLDLGPGLEVRLVLPSGAVERGHVEHPIDEQHQYDETRWVVRLYRQDEQSEN